MLHELSTIVSGLERAVRDESVDATSASAAASDLGAANTMQRATRRLAGLERSVEAAKQRLGNYLRSEMHFSSHEEQYLSNAASRDILAPHALYSAANAAHIDLSRVSSLESQLATLHEQCIQAHSTLSSLASLSPLQQQVTSFLQRRSVEPNHSAETLQSLLDSLRTAAFELQSLGVLLPSHTAFPDSHLTPPHARRDWPWLEQLKQAMKKRSASK